MTFESEIELELYRREVHQFESPRQSFTRAEETQRETPSPSQLVPPWRISQNASGRDGGWLDCWER